MTTRNVRSTVTTSNATVNYDLPLWSGEDVTTWQGNLNDAMNKIDTAIFANKTAMDGYKDIADKLEDTNDSTVELVNQVNQQLTDINAKYDEVKAELEEASKQITEGNQAILALQQEDETVKVQMDAMQDDIGKLMECIIGKNFTIPNGKLLNVSDDSETNVVCNATCYIGSTMQLRIVIPPGQYHIYMSESDIKAIAEFFNINFSEMGIYAHPVYYKELDVSIGCVGRRVNDIVSFEFTINNGSSTNWTVRYPVWMNRVAG